MGKPVDELKNKKEEMVWREKSRKEEGEEVEDEEEGISQASRPPVNQPVRQSSRRGSFSVARSLTYSLATRCVN